MTELQQLQQYADKMEFVLQRHSLERAIKALPYVEALALIRAAYRDESGKPASLEHAKLIYRLITEPNPFLTHNM